MLIIKSSTTSILFIFLTWSSWSLMVSDLELVGVLNLLIKESSLSAVFLIDWLTLQMIFTVSLVSFSVFLYSETYMANDLFKKKFTITLFLFVLSMVVLVLSADLFWMMVGWDGLGITSFFLIVFFQNWKSFNSAMVTFLTNRLGDSFLLLSLAWWMGSESSFYSGSQTLTYMVSILLVMGGMSKSAQFPFSSWLPLAMAAPTPVSSLVHSSTLVTAGVFLLVRFKSFVSESVYQILFYFSALTIILATSSSMGEFDLKKVIALSTLSHISLMLMFVSFKAYEVALFHLTVHAFFKSLLFMIAGILIHSSGGSQDLRVVSLNSLDTPLGMSLVCSLMSMTGIPVFAGFVSKENLLQTMSESEGFVTQIVFFLSVMMTSSYSSRIFYLLISEKKESVSVESSENWKIFSMMSVFSISSGSLFLFSYEFSSTFLEEMKMVVLISVALGAAVGVFFSKMQGSSVVLKALSSMWWLKSAGMVVQAFFFSLSFWVFQKFDSKGGLAMVEKVQSDLVNPLESIFLFFYKFPVLLVGSSFLSLYLMTLI